MNGNRIVRSRFSLRDLVTEAGVGMLARPGRTVLTILGTVLGIAALVSTLGLAKTAGNQIVTRFDALAATSVTVENRTQGFSFSGTPQESNIPWDAEDRLTRLNGVVAAGTQSIVDTNNELARSVPINDPLGQSEFSIDVYAASPGLFDAIGATLATGRFYDEGHNERQEPVAVLGPGAARRLNISRVDQQPAIFIGDTTLVVVGILDDTQREPVLLDAIIIPNGTARHLFNLGAPAEVQVRTELGAAQLIGQQAAIALSPNDPSLLRVTVPPEPKAVKEQVEADVNTLFLVLGAVALLVGAIGIANVTLVSVLERVGEIGLRRAVERSDSGEPWGPHEDTLQPSSLPNPQPWDSSAASSGHPSASSSSLPWQPPDNGPQSWTHGSHSPHPSLEQQPDSSQASTRHGVQHPSNPSTPSEPACEPHPAIRQTTDNKNLDEVKGRCHVRRM